VVGRDVAPLVGDGVRSSTLAVFVSPLAISFASDT
jgi:hypothetical protein